MASVISDPNGRKRIQFVAGDGNRRAIRLGKATVRQAEAVKVKVEQLVLAATGVTGVVDDETVDWLTGLNDAMYDKLAGVGLVGLRESVKLRAFSRCVYRRETRREAGHRHCLQTGYWQSNRIFRRR
jgi:hypothetical protein